MGLLGSRRRRQRCVSLPAAGLRDGCAEDLLIKYMKDKAAEQKEGNGKPFFAVLSVQPPHDPNMAPEQFMANYDPARCKCGPTWRTCRR